eukprot:2732778-Alexandrium_andersonii.AAC.1
MSASLVGSEMCIRDRCLLRAVGRVLKFGHLHGAGVLSPQEMARGTVAVSYTHLTLPTICSV